jgi:multiple sugar transport system permease protein
MLSRSCQLKAWLHRSAGRGAMKRAALTSGKYAVAVLIAAFILAPILWVVLCSLKPNSELLLYPPTILPQRITFEHYIDLFKDTYYAAYFGNSLLVALVATPLTLLVATPGAYSLTRFKVRGRNLFAGFLLFSYMVPLLLLGLPMFMLMSRLHLLNTRTSLVISYAAFCLPFCMWMLRSFFLSIPISLEEAAMVDGASRGQALRKIVLPLARPGVISCSIFTFVLVWNEYTLALLFIRSEQLKTLPLGMAAFMGRVASQWGYLLPAIVLMIAPLFFVFAFIQRALIRGFLAGATKG